MNLFDRLVNEALQNQPNLSSLRPVVEKELLHHDILRIMRDNNLTTELTFIGGTCLRCCYGGVRLSEDLDFTGGSNFSKEKLSSLGRIISESLQDKYGLRVNVSEPLNDNQDEHTWKIRVETKPRTKHLPAQRINVDICSLTSYERRPRMLLNPYGVDMGTSGLIIQAQSCEEIYSDKLIAVAYRANRIKYRDIWDIFWLHSIGQRPRVELIPNKVEDRQHTIENFLHLFGQRVRLLKEKREMAAEFKQEMRRFLPAMHLKTVEHENYWDFILNLFEDWNNQLRNNFNIKARQGE